MPFYLASEKHLGFPTMTTYLTIWMACAIFAYWFCGWLCDLFGRRYVIPAFAVPAAVLLVVMGQLDSPSSLFWVGLATNFLITGSFGTGLGYTAEIFPTQIRGTAVGATFAVGLAFASLAPMIIGWIATAHSVAAGLPLLALSFFLLGPLFFWFAPDVTRRDLVDFRRPESGVSGEASLCHRSPAWSEVECRAVAPQPRISLRSLRAMGFEVLAVGVAHVDAKAKCVRVTVIYRAPKSGLSSTAAASPVCKFSTVTALCGYLRLRCSAASMAIAWSSRYVRGRTINRDLKLRTGGLFHCHRLPAQILFGLTTDGKRGFPPTPNVA
jgi:MFS family permease